MLPPKMFENVVRGFLREKETDTFSIDIKHLVPFCSLGKEETSFLGEHQLNQHVICLPSVCQLARSKATKWQFVRDLLQGTVILQFLCIEAYASYVWHTGISNDLKRGLAFKNSILLSINHCPWKFFHQFTGPLLLWMPATMISQAGMMKTNINRCLQLQWLLIKKNKSSWSYKNSVCNLPAYPACPGKVLVWSCKPKGKLRTWDVPSWKRRRRRRAVPCPLAAPMDGGMLPAGCLCCVPGNGPPSMVGMPGSSWSHPANHTHTSGNLRHPFGIARPQQ